MGGPRSIPCMAEKNVPAAAAAAALGWVGSEAEQAAPAEQGRAVRGQPHKLATTRKCPDKPARMGERLRAYGNVIEQTREEQLHGVTRVDGFSQRCTRFMHGGGGTIEGSSGSYLPALPWRLSLWAEKKTRGRRKEAAIEQARQLPFASAPVRVCVCASGINPLAGWPSCSALLLLQCKGVRVVVMEPLPVYLA